MAPPLLLRMAACAAAAAALTSAAAALTSAAAAAAGESPPAAEEARGADAAAAAGLLDWVPEEAIPAELVEAATSAPGETGLFVLFANGVRQHKCIAKDVTTPIRTTAVLYARQGSLLGDLAGQPLGDDFPPLRAVGISREDYGGAGRDRPTHLWELRLFKPHVDAAHVQAAFGGAVGGSPADLLQNADLGRAVRDALFADNSAVHGDFVPVGDGGATPDGGPAVFAAVPPAADPAATLIPDRQAFRRRSALGTGPGLMDEVRHVIRVRDAAAAPPGGALKCEPGGGPVEEPYSAQFHFRGVRDAQTKRRKRRRDEM